MAPLVRTWSAENFPVELGNWKLAARTWHPFHYRKLRFPLFLRYTLIGLNTRLSKKQSLFLTADQTLLTFLLRPDRVFGETS